MFVCQRLGCAVVWLLLVHLSMVIRDGVQLHRHVGLALSRIILAHEWSESSCIAVLRGLLLGICCCKSAAGCFKQVGLLLSKAASCLPFGLAVAAAAPAIGRFIHLQCEFSCLLLHVITSIICAGVPAAAAVLQALTKWPSAGRCDPAACTSRLH